MTNQYLQQNLTYPFYGKARQKTIEILAGVCTDYQVSPLDLLGRKRDQLTREARKGAYKQLWAETHMSLSKIGKIFNRHHSTISRGLR